MTITIRPTVSATSPADAKKTVVLRTGSGVVGVATDVVRSVTSRAP